MFKEFKWKFDLKLRNFEENLEKIWKESQWKFVARKNLPGISTKIYCLSRFRMTCLLDFEMSTKFWNLESSDTFSSQHQKLPRYLVWAKIGNMGHSHFS